MTYVTGTNPKNQIYHDTYNYSFQSVVELLLNKSLQGLEKPPKKVAKRSEITV